MTVLRFQELEVSAPHSLASGQLQEEASVIKSPSSFWQTVREDAVLKHYNILPNVMSLPPILYRELPLFGKKTKCCSPLPWSYFKIGAGEDPASLS